MCGPMDGFPSCRICPGHVFRRQNSNRDAQHWDHCDQRRAEETPQQKVAAVHRRREDDRIRVMLEIPQRREIHEGRGHQQAEEAEKGIAVLDYEGCIAIRIGNAGSQGNLIGAAGEEHQQGNAQKEDPQHPGTKPETDFKPRDLAEHSRLP